MLFIFFSIHSTATTLSKRACRYSIYTLNDCYFHSHRCQYAAWMPWFKNWVNFLLFFLLLLCCVNLSSSLYRIHLHYTDLYIVWIHDYCCWFSSTMNSFQLKCSFTTSISPLLFLFFFCYKIKWWHYYYSNQSHSRTIIIMLLFTIHHFQSIAHTQLLLFNHN